MKETFEEWNQKIVAIILTMSVMRSASTDGLRPKVVIKEMSDVKEKNIWQDTDGIENGFITDSPREYKFKMKIQMTNQENDLDFFFLLGLQKEGC